MRLARFPEAAATVLGALATLDCYRKVHLLNTRSGLMIHVEGMRSDEHNAITCLEDAKGDFAVPVPAAIERLH